ncbi:MAG: hypothetical protein HFE76_05205 [Firmicutes bacterium]|nr:hypothetical protein [Bacillota bacterium]
MDITTGMVLLGTGIAGTAACVILLCIMEKNWKKQRKKMLQEIEKEE